MKSLSMIINKIKKLEIKRKQFDDELTKINWDLKVLKGDLVDNENYFWIKTYMNNFDSKSFVISKKIYDTIDPSKLINSSVHDTQKLFNVTIDRDVGNINEFKKFLEPFILNEDYFIVGQNA